MPVRRQVHVIAHQLGGTQFEHRFHILLRVIPDLQPTQSLSSQGGDVLADGPSLLESHEMTRDPQRQRQMSAEPRNLRNSGSDPFMPTMLRRSCRDLSGVKTPILHRGHSVEGQGMAAGDDEAGLVPGNQVPDLSLARGIVEHDQRPLAREGASVNRQ